MPGPTMFSSDSSLSLSLSQFRLFSLPPWPVFGLDYRLHLPREVPSTSLLLTTTRDSLILLDSGLDLGSSSQLLPHIARTASGPQTSQTQHDQCKCDGPSSYLSSPSSGTVPEPKSSGYSGCFPCHSPSSFLSVTRFCSFAF